MKISFDVKYRPQIESGAYKVETRSGKTARIICWDRVGTQLVVLVGKDEDVLTYNSNGTTGQQMPLPSDLFIITPEEELTEFEEGLKTFLFNFVHTTVEEDPIEYIKKNSDVLLSLAREQFIKDGGREDRYLESEKSKRQTLPTSGKVEEFVKNSAIYMQGGIATNVPDDMDDMKEILDAEYEKGRADVLKYLPKWRFWENGACGNGEGIPLALVVRGLNGFELVDSLGTKGEKYILLSDLKKLPGYDDVYSLPEPYELYYESRRTLL